MLWAPATGAGTRLLATGDEFEPEVAVKELAERQRLG